MVKSEKQKRHLKKLNKNHKGKNNPNWKGNKVGYKALHKWIRQHKPKPKLCEICGKNEPYDLANISGEYKRDINDFEWICRGCHIKKDGRMKGRLERLGLNINKFRWIGHKKMTKEEKKKYLKEYYKKNREKFLI
jgi:hypothetical protein